MRILIALTGLLLGFAGCSDTSPEAQIRSLIPEASSISNADFNTVAFSGQALSRNQVKSQSLSWLLMVTPVSAIEASPAHSNDFRYFGDIHPAKLGEAMWKSKGKGYATLIQPEFIESVDCEIVGENAVGTVSFTASGLYAGKVEFTAARRSNRWQIEQFRLPGYRLKTTRGSDGLWKEEPWDSLESNIKDAQQDAEPDTAKPGE